MVNYSVYIFCCRGLLVEVSCQVYVVYRGDQLYHSVPSVCCTVCNYQFCTIVITCIEIATHATRDAQPRQGPVSDMAFPTRTLSACDITREAASYLQNLLFGVLVSVPLFASDRSCLLAMTSLGQFYCLYVCLSVFREHTYSSCISNSSVTPDPAERELQYSHGPHRLVP